MLLRLLSSLLTQAEVTSAMLKLELPAHTKELTPL